MTHVPVIALMDIVFFSQVAGLQTCDSAQEELIRIIFRIYRRDMAADAIELNFSVDMNEDPTVAWRSKATVVSPSAGSAFLGRSHNCQVDAEAPGLASTHHLNCSSAVLPLGMHAELLA
jgi:hypothetical protein